jgi:tRNA threonylcarbamoyl adenosine modification protein (Sua5/YciO/YrdC/YwlC family)
MIEYVVGKNPDDRVLQRAVQALAKGDVISFPTESHWVFAASLKSKKAVDSLYRIKNMDKHKHLTLLCGSISQASEMAIISNYAFKLIKKVIPGPYTFILEPTKQLPRVIKDYGKDKEIGVRFPRNPFARRLLSFYEEPLLTTSITAETFNGTMHEGDQDMEIFSYQIDDVFGHALGMVIDPDCGDIIGEGSIIDFSKGDSPEIIREGQGDLSLFF